MTTEEIIQRLLDERKITVKEALTILKDVVRNEVIYHAEGYRDYPYPFTTVMYGISSVVSSSTYAPRNDNNISCSTNE